MASLQTAPFPLEAARTGRYQAIAEWQQSGGHLDAPFRFEDWSPLQLLCAEGNRDGVRALCECGALPNGRQRSSLAGLPTTRAARHERAHRQHLARGSWCARAPLRGVERSPILARFHHSSLGLPLAFFALVIIAC